MKRFRYGLDPLCLLSCGLYAACRWLIRPHTTAVFWHSYSTDYLFIPAALPLMLWVYRRLGLRNSDEFPTWGEIGQIFVIWSVAAEGVAPLLFKSAVGDWWDVATYAVGSVIAGCWWTLAGRPGFDLLAPHYVWMEKILAGPRLQRCRTTWLDQLAGSRRLLIAGVGHGPTLAEAMTRHPQLHITCVDASAGMLAVARERARFARLDPTRLEFVHASLPGWAPPERFDALATHFFLDCFTPAQLTEVVAALARISTPDARWIVSDFALPEGRLARWRAQAIHRLMYFFFRVFTRLPARRWTEPDTLLRAQGFHLAGRRSTEWGLLRADLWQRVPAAG